MLRKIERALKQKNPEFVMGTLTKAQKAKKAPTKKTTTTTASKTTTRRRF